MRVAGWARTGDDEWTRKASMLEPPNNHPSIVRITRRRTLIGTRPATIQRVEVLDNQGRLLEQQLFVNKIVTAKALARKKVKQYKTRRNT